MDNSDLIKEVDQLVSDRKIVEEIWQLLEQYVVPYKGKFYQDIYSEHQIDWHNPQLYDSTAIIANDILASSMQTALTNPAIRWARLVFSNEKYNKAGEAMEWLQECEDRQFGTINASNFNLEAAEFYTDLTGLGTASMSEEINPDPGPDERFLNFDTIPIKEWYFVEDHRGRPIRAYRIHMWTPIQMKAKFGEDKLPDEIKAKLEVSSGVSNRKLKVVQCIYPRPGKENANIFTKLSATERPFAGKYLLHSSKEMLGDEMGYYEMPVFMTRWKKASGSIWGFCPGMICMPTILTLNGLSEASLEALGKVVDPASLVTERGLLSDLDLGRGGLTVVRSTDELRPYESGARFDVGELKMNIMKAEINRAFHVDQLELKDSPAMTATEAHIRYELMQRLLGPTLGRIQTDWLDPMTERTFRSMYRERMFPPMPQELEDADAQMLVEYTGPLPMSQKAPIVQAVREWVADVTALKEIKPDVDDRIDYDAITLGVGISKGVPARYMRSDEDMKVMRDNRKQDEDRMKEAALVQAAGDAAQSAGAGQQALQEANVQ